MLQSVFGSDHRQEEVEKLKEALEGLSKSRPGTAKPLSRSPLTTQPEAVVEVPVAASDVAQTSPTVSPAPSRPTTARGVRSEAIPTMEAPEERPNRVGSGGVRRMPKPPSSIRPKPRSGRRKGSTSSPAPSSPRSKRSQDATATRGAKSTSGTRARSRDKERSRIDCSPKNPRRKLLRSVSSPNKPPSRPSPGRGSPLRLRRSDSAGSRGGKVARSVMLPTPPARPASSPMKYRPLPAVGQSRDEDEP